MPMMPCEPPSNGRVRSETTRTRMISPDPRVANARWSPRTRAHQQAEDETREGGEQDGDGQSRPEGQLGDGDAGWRSTGTRPW